MTSLILRTVTRFMLPLLLLFSLLLLLRGHNEPGGGFSGGLVAASAFVLYGLAYGVAAVRRALPVQMWTLTGLGLLVAVVSGVLSLLAGFPFMTGMWLPLPGFNHLMMGTPFVFDVGVYLVVVGVTLAIIFPLTEE